MVEGARLESVYRGNSIEGSNPSLSATERLSNPETLDLRHMIAAPFAPKSVRN